jgi:hypothetical protein
VALQQCRRWPAFDAGYARHYNESNSIDDLLSASAAWHSLVPDRQLAGERVESSHHAILADVCIYATAPHRHLVYSPVCFLGEQTRPRCARLSRNLI